MYVTAAKPKKCTLPSPWGKTAVRYRRPGGRPVRYRHCQLVFKLLF